MRKSRSLAILGTMRRQGQFRRYASARTCTAVYAGSFNPPTVGHLDMIERSMKFCDKLVVGVGHNIEKKYAFSADERLKLLRSMVQTNIREEIASKVQFKAFQGLLADFAMHEGANMIIRGVRNTEDLEFETQRSLLTRDMSGIESVFLPSRHPTVSSSIVRELAHFRTSVPGLVPDSIAETVFERLEVRYERNSSTGQLEFPRPLESEDGQHADAGVRNNSTD